MPNNWKTYKLGDIDEIQIIDGDRGKNYPKKNEFKHKGFCLFLSAKNVTKLGFEFSELSFVSKEKDELLRKGKLNKKDIVLTTRGTVGNIGYFKDSIKFENVRINSGMVIIRANENYVDSSYLYQFLKSSAFQFQVDSRVSGSAQPQLPIRDLNFIEINLPTLPEQKAIASILSAIDDKIENNLATNKTLEEMAMALYKHWFVDFGPFQEGEFIDSELGKIPKGWEVKRLDEVANVNSKSIKKDNIPNDIEYIDIASVKEGWVEEIKPMLYVNAPSRAKRIISDGDIVWSTVRPNRKSRFLSLGYSNKTIVSTGFSVISPKSVSFAYLYLYTCTDDFVEYLSSRATGSSYPAVTGKVFEESKIIVPNEKVLNGFKEIVEPMFIQSSINSKENQTLTQLRDTILPKLISGEVRLQEFQEKVNNVISGNEVSVE